MSALTQVYTLALKAESDLKDTNSAAAKIVKECCDSIASQQGIEKVFFGTVFEDPRKLQLFLNWKSDADCEKFKTKDAYQIFQANLDSLSTGTVNVVHIHFQPESGVVEALSAPIAEVATFYFDKMPPATAFEGAKTLLEALKQGGTNVLGWAYGTTQEVIEKDGAKGRGNMLVVGWENLEAHAASHETQALKDNIQGLTTPEVKAIEMHHVQATAYDGD